MKYTLEKSVYSKEFTSPIYLQKWYSVSFERNVKPLLSYNKGYYIYINKQIAKLSAVLKPSTSLFELPRTAYPFELAWFLCCVLKELSKIRSQSSVDERHCAVSTLLTTVSNLIKRLGTFLFRSCYTASEYRKTPPVLIVCILVRPCRVTTLHARVNSLSHELY